MLRIFASLFFFIASVNSFSQEISIIPKPASLQKGSGTFSISKQTVIAIKNEADRNAANFLNDYLQQYYGFKLDVDKQESRNYIRLTTRQFMQAPAKEGYSLTVTKDGVTIEGDSNAGTFYGIQSLIQLLPVYAGATKTSTITIPFVSINDAPRFTYRGMHLDVGRHFFPVAFIKKYIDYIALHKMNYFHWHLTEDQGWRIEIKKYPKLTEIGGCRDGTIIGRYPGKGNDSTRYCGYYTQEEVREVVRYAADRHITVVPEIEMPGHSSAALTSYTWLGCPDTGPYKVEETWGIFEDVYCAGKDSTFQFLQDVLDEVIELFPSKYIHVGGDESPKANWRKCPLCQARIKAEGLKDEHELQSYFIQRMEKYINSKGRTLIGWDEILEGGLAPNAIVMSWRGEEGGIAAAKENHYVIMTPGNYVYLDHAQSRNEDSVTIGNFTPVEETYSYEPVPKELAGAQAKYVLGAQGNVWTEYMRYPSKVEYMIFPRMSALSEVLWTEAKNKNWTDFEKRLRNQYKRYRLWGANFSSAYYDIDAAILPAAGGKGVQVRLQSKDKSGKMMYAIPGVHFPKNYTSPVQINNNAEVTALYYKEGQLLDSITLKLQVNKATGKKITLINKPLEGYTGNGAFTLVDGIVNERGIARANEFIGYRGKNMQAVIDLGSAQSIKSVTTHAITSGGSRVRPPQSMDVFISSDGKTYKQVGSTQQFLPTTQGKGMLQLQIAPVTARYLKMVVTPVMKIAEGEQGAGEQALMFIDEIEVN
jgi:hexosaminidase